MPAPELRGIRERLRKQRARLRGTLESYLRGKDTAKYLQQQIVTDRNGRYVLVVRAEHRARSRHRARQLRAAARACSSSRSAPSRSTTTSSRSSSRRRRKSAASCWRCATRSAGAPRISSARSTPRHELDVLQARALSRISSTASSRRSRPTAARAARRAPSPAADSAVRRSRGRRPGAQRRRCR